MMAGGSTLRGAGVNPGIPVSIDLTAIYILNFDNFDRHLDSFDNNPFAR